MIVVCNYCGDLAVELCGRQRPEWIIALPSELKPHDLWRRPIDGTLYSVREVIRDSEEEFRIFTNQDGKTFFVWRAQLPLLVKRQVACGWPRCEFHCERCILNAELDEQRARLMGDEKEASAARERKKAIKRKQIHASEGERGKPSNQYG